MIAHLVDELTVLGFSERIAQAYVLLAQKGEISVREIGKRFSLSRPTAHDVMMSLVGHGLARTKISGKDRIFVMGSPSMIREKLEEKRRECEIRVERFDVLLPNLLAVSLAKNGGDPVVRYAEGLEEITPVLREFSEVSGDVLQLLDEETFTAMHHRITIEGGGGVTKKIRSMVITDRRIGGCIEADGEVRAISPHIVFALGEMSVCGDRVLFLSHVGGMRVASIRSQPMADVCRAALELAWCAAGRIGEWMGEKG